MSIVSFNFFVFLAAVVILYYVIPIKARWVVLFAANIAFWLLCSSIKMLAFALIPIFITFFIALALNNIKDKVNSRIITLLLVIGILSDVGFLIVFKELNFFINGADYILGIWNIDIPTVQFVAPLGVSYFTLTLLSYLLDAHWGVCDVIKNPIRFVTYILFFPTLTSGPIMRTDKVADGILQGNRFDYKKVCFGAQRLCWGLFKKLVLAERLALVVSSIGEGEYAGLYVLLGALLYSLQLYMDFSGCMDIIIGASEMLGVKLPENFNTPLFATTLSEYWRRWHITLGLWVKDYVMNPILKSKGMQRLGKATKKKFGKKFGKKIPVWIGMFCTWFVVGFWHGGAWTFIFGSGLFFFGMIFLGQLLEPFTKWLIKKLHINESNIVWKTWQRVRTFVLFSVSISFSWATSLSDGFMMWGRFFESFNPYILWDGSLLELGLDIKNWIVVIIGLLIVLIVSNLQQKGSVREMIARRNIVVRWAVYLCLFFVVLIFGKYGQGYNAADFIYGGF